MDHWRIILFDASGREINRGVLLAADPAEALRRYRDLFGFSPDLVGMACYDIEKNEYPVTQ